MTNTIRELSNSELKQIAGGGGAAIPISGGGRIDGGPDLYISLDNWSFAPLPIGGIVGNWWILPAGPTLPLPIPKPDPNLGKP